MKMVKWAMTHNVWLSTTFEVQCILGWGGCGVVLGATRRSNNEEVAIKIIYRQLSIECNPDGLPKEISLHQFLEHPNIVESIEHSSDDHAYYLVMERFGVRWNNHTGGASITITAIDPTLQDVSNDLASVHNTVVHHPHRPTHERRRYLRRADQIPPTPIHAGSIPKTAGPRVKESHSRVIKKALFYQEFRNDARRLL
ncbi:hypothetical protein BSLG_003987 [Batrachochytrium salamandrivorans]|nr:hypothetical protein BSLG_003987 [Batrachochytrium salamandrivorans]